MKALVNATALAAVLGLAACASPGPIGTDPSIQLVDLQTLPTPPRDANAIIRPEDTLKINVLGFADLAREIKVDTSGTFQFPLIGVVDAEGRTALMIAQDIADRLRGRYVREPEVTVDITEQPGRVFTVGGEVRTPGRYPIGRSVTLLEAVATGGGTSDTAQLDDVLVLRTVADQRYIGVYNLEAIQRGNYADPLIYPGDIVQVGDSPTLRRIQAIATLSPIITTPLILLERVLR